MLEGAALRIYRRETPIMEVNLHFVLYEDLAVSDEVRPANSESGDLPTVARLVIVRGGRSGDLGFAVADSE